MVRVAVMGASGYTGVELLRLLALHPNVEITVVTSRQHDGEPISDAFPTLYGVVDLVCSNPPAAEVARQADVVFTALPHKSAMAVVPDLLAQGSRVVDLSADFRLVDVDVYEAWYQEHSCPELINAAVYGLPEIFREQIIPAQLVANPGCYPTSAALALAPLLESGCLDHTSIIIDSKSGTSGAGRGVKLGSLFCEVNESFMAYGVASHRHTPEIEQTLSKVSGQDIQVTFTPHLLPVNRGILSTCYAQLSKKVTIEEIATIYAEKYASEPFVRVLPAGKFPNIASVRGSNFCDIGLALDERRNRVVAIAAIDNLVKGAAGQAIQNMNLMCGWREETGLSQLPLFP